MSPIRARRARGILFLTLVVMLLAPGGAQAFDTGPHSDITRDALSAEGFTGTAADVAVVSNWFVDLYSNASKIPQSGHAKTRVEIVGSLFGPRENWSDAIVDAAVRTHFDSSMWDVANVARAEAEWNRVQRSTSQLLREITSRGAPDTERQILTTIGMGLHQLQDFYSHSNWIEKKGFPGVDGTDWSAFTVGLTPTWFDVPKSTRDGLNVYIGESTGHEERPHGAWNTDGNRSMEHGVNKDWPGRAGYPDAYTTAYFASRQWVRAVRAALGDEALWERVTRYADRRGGELDHDLDGALRIGMMTGHWQGQGEPCDPKFSLNICGSRNGLGGDLIGARNAIRDYFEDRRRTRFRDTFEALIGVLAHPQPSGDLLPVAASRDMQETTRFVHLQVRSMKNVGVLRALGDPSLLDRADMFTRATIAGQRFQSGEINGRDSFSFPLPYAPFAFIRAFRPGTSYPEPVSTMTVEVRTSSSAFSGTDDDVFLRIGPNRRFALDKRLYDDFERGDRDTYSVPIDGAVLAGLTVGDITRVQIEKSPDGVGGAWKLRGVKLAVNGRTVYARSGIDRWLEKGSRTWRAPNFTPATPAGLGIPITLDLWDEDSFVFGADDHGDINRLDRRKRLALVYVPDTDVTPTRASGGSLHGGRIGDGDRASLVYTIETLTPRPPSPPPPDAPPPATAAPPPPPPAPKPDLVISALGYTPEAQWRFTVTNRGQAAAGNFSVSVSGEGTYAIPGLAAGASATRTFRTTCRVFTWEARADSGAQVDESDEANNTRSYTEDVCIA